MEGNNFSTLERKEYGKKCSVLSKKYNIPWNVCTILGTDENLYPKFVEITKNLTILNVSDVTGFYEGVGIDRRNAEIKNLLPDEEFSKVWNQRQRNSTIMYDYLHSRIDRNEKRIQKRIEKQSNEKLEKYKQKYAKNEIMNEFLQRDKTGKMIYECMREMRERRISYQCLDDIMDELNDKNKESLQQILNPGRIGVLAARSNNGIDKVLDAFLSQSKVPYYTIGGYNVFQELIKQYVVADFHYRTGKTIDDTILYQEPEKIIDKYYEAIHELLPEYEAATINKICNKAMKEIENGFSTANIDNFIRIVTNPIFDYENLKNSLNENINLYISTGINKLDNYDQREFLRSIAQDPTIIKNTTSYIKSGFNADQVEQIRFGRDAGVDVSKYTILDSEGKPAFTWEQMEEIRLGLEAGKDVSVYTILNSEGKPVFDADQMRQIRWGLEAGIDVSIYAKQEFNYKQMEQIREGFRHNLTPEQIKIYAALGSEGKPIFDDYQMSEIRQGLEAGKDVSIYTILDSEGKPVFNDFQMKQIREGREAGIDISKYTILDSEGKPVFDGLQMKQIRKGLGRGLDVSDVSKYTILNSEGKPAFNWGQMHEIREGLEAEKDVSIYTILDSERKPAFYAGEMEEIRKGLIAGIDVSVYTILNSEGKPVFNGLEMREIREGLEAGIDINVYTKLDSEGKSVFNHWQMQQIREDLEAGKDVSIYTILDSEGKPVFDGAQMYEIREGFKHGLTPEQIKIYAALDSEKTLFDHWRMAQIREALESGLPKEIVKQEIAKPELSYKEMAERKEELDEEFYKLGEEGLLEKYGITPEKENSMEENETEKDENTLDASEEMSL